MGKIQAMTGNTAAYTGAALCRPDLIAAYPITPQSSVIEGLAGLVYNGKLDARFVQVESEHSAMSVVQGTAAAGELILRRVMQIAGSNCRLRLPEPFRSRRAWNKDALCLL